MDLINLIFLKIIFISIINKNTYILCNLVSTELNNELKDNLNLNDYSLNNINDTLNNINSEKPINSDILEITQSENYNVEFPNGNYLSKDENKFNSDNVNLNKLQNELNEINDEDDTEAYIKTDKSKINNQNINNNNNNNSDFFKLSDKLTDNLSDILSDNNLSEKVSNYLYGEYSTEYIDDYNKSIEQNIKMDHNKEYNVKTITPPDSLMILATPSGCSLLDYQDDNNEFSISEFKFKLSDLEDCGTLTKDIMEGLQEQLSNEIILNKLPETKMVEISIRDPLRNKELNVKETTQIFNSSNRSGHNYNNNTTNNRNNKENNTNNNYQNNNENNEFDKLFDEKYQGLNFKNPEEQEAWDLLSEKLDIQFLPTSSDSVFIVSYTINDMNTDESKRYKLMDDFLKLLDTFIDVDKNNNNKNKKENKTTNNVSINEKSENENDNNNITKSTDNNENKENNNKEEEENNYDNMNNYENEEDNINTNHNDWFKRLQNLPTEVIAKFVDDAKKLFETEEGKKELEKIGKEFDKHLKETEEYIKKEILLGKQILDDLSKHGMDNIECSKLTKENCTNYSKCQVMEVNEKDICFVSPKTIYWLMSTNCGLQTRPALMSIARDLKNVGYLNDQILNNLETTFNSDKICKVITHSYLSKLSPKENKQQNNPFN